MTQTWTDLLFAHWPIEVSALTPRIPAPLRVDEFGGSAWLGIVPFHMSNVSVRGVPAIPGLSAFPELNLRTYVRADNRPGVYFFSLDAASLTAVLGARALLNLPYFLASMDVRSDAGVVRYRSRRRLPGRSSGEFAAVYRPNPGASFEAVPGTLEYFLTERYCLYGVGHFGRVFRLEINHRPWSLQAADAQIDRNSMAKASGFDLPSVAPLLHFAKRQDVVAWRPMPLGASRPPTGDRN